MRRLLLALFGSLLFGFVLVHAQSTPQPRSRPPASPPSPLAVRRVVLYKNGIGYFEHLGKVRGNQTVAVDFNSSQLDDVLKSLTALDLGNGRVGTISYNSVAPTDRQIAALQFEGSGATSRADVLNGLRGDRLEVQSGSRRLSGRLLGVVPRSIRVGQNVVAEDELTLVTDRGDMTSIRLTPETSIRMLERDSAARLSSYLGVMANARASDRRRLSIATEGTGERDLLLSYVSEVPIWKSTYRIVLPPDGGSPFVQGWAIVDNTTGQDWTNVELSLVSGAPQSFIERISQPLYVRRPVVNSSPALMHAPQTHGATLGIGTATLRGIVRDTSGAVMPGVTVSIAGPTGTINSTTTADGSFRVAGLTPGTYEITYSLAGFNSVRREQPIAAGRIVTADASMKVGALEETITVAAASPALDVADEEEAESIDTLQTGRTLAARLAGVQPVASATELTDMFEYRMNGTMTVRRGESALVPILNSAIEAEPVTIWSAGGNRPLRALWVKNSTKLTFDGGSFAVLEGATFAGEGLLQPFGPGERRLLSYATDLGVIVSAEDTKAPAVVRRVLASRGLMVEHWERREHTVYTVRNNNATARTVVVEHPRRDGFTIVSDEPPTESSAEAHRFSVRVGAHETASLTVEERTGSVNRVQVASIDDARLALLVQGAADSAPLRAALRPILARKAEIAALQTKVGEQTHAIATMTDAQTRARNNLTALKDAPDARKLVVRYATQIAESEDQIADADRQRREVSGKLEEAQKGLRDEIERLAIDLVLAAN